MTTDKLPFQDLTIVELASVLAGPAVGMFFAELGAEVIKIENPTMDGDVTRSWKHPSEDPNKKTSAYYHSVNYQKNSIFLNAKIPSEKEQILDLIKKADIVISNFRSSTANKLGLDYATVKSFCADIIFGEISAYGDGTDRPGFDALLQAETGWMHMNGQAEGPPTKMPVAMIDLLAAHQLKEGLLVALIKKLKTGKGSRVTVSLYDAAVSALANQASNYLNLNIIPARKGSQHPNIAPYGDIFKTKDDELILLAVGNDKQFQSLCHILDLSYLVTDPKFKTNTDRVNNRQALITYLETAIKNVSTETFLKNCTEHSVPAGKLRDLKDLFTDELSKDLVLIQQETDGTESKRVKTVVFKMD